MTTEEGQAGRSGYPIDRIGDLGRALGAVLVFAEIRRLANEAASREPVLAKVTLELLDQVERMRAESPAP